MSKLSNEAKVGFLVSLALVLGVGFAWVLGVENPFKKSHEFFVTYEFAGGIEVDSPVRVSGIKVGKVTSIEFFVPIDSNKISNKEPGSAEAAEGSIVVPVRLTINVDQNAAEGIRTDSRFYINLAGIIGERYVEITPGSMEQPKIGRGETVAGVDPPRVDQLLSQSFNLAGKMVDILEKNEGDITKTISLMLKLSRSLNKTLGDLDKSKIFKTEISALVENLVAVTKDVRTITSKVQTEEGKKTLELLHNLLWRLEPLNPDVIRQFLQEEGIRARIF